LIKSFLRNSDAIKTNVNSALEIYFPFKRCFLFDLMLNFCPQAVKTLQKANPSAVIASLNSAYAEQMGQSRSPYDIVREEVDDSESPSSPDFQVPDLVQRRVSFSQLQQEGDAGIF
jgi:hypothetical protein